MFRRTHSEASAINGVELGIGVPSFVEVDARHAARQSLVTRCTS